MLIELGFVECWQVMSACFGKMLMLRTIMVVVCLVPSLIHAVERQLTGDSMEWRGSAGGKSAVKVISQFPLDVAVSVGGGEEGFPRIHLSPPQAWDLREYNRIAGEVRLESDDAGIKSGGKDIVFVVSDNGLRNESMQSRPAVQQLLSAHVKVGDWQVISLSLTTLVRSQCNGLSIYLYDGPYNYPHAYKFTFRNLRLIAPDPGEALFDGVTYSKGGLTGVPSEEAATLKTEDGLAMVLAKNGGILKFLDAGAEIGDGTRQASGILLRDAETDHPPVMAGGTVTATPEVGDRVPICRR